MVKPAPQSGAEYLPSSVEFDSRALSCSDYNRLSADWQEAGFARLDLRTDSWRNGNCTVPFQPLASAFARLRPGQTIFACLSAIAPSRSDGGSSLLIWGQDSPEANAVPPVGGICFKGFANPASAGVGCIPAAAIHAADFIPSRMPVVIPLPHVHHHVVQAVAVRLEVIDGGRVRTFFVLLQPLGVVGTRRADVVADKSLAVCLPPLKSFPFPFPLKCVQQHTEADG